MISLCGHMLITVSVSSPWNTITFMPPNAMTYVNCTGRRNGSDPHWLVFFSGTDGFVTFTDSSSGLFNRRGFYLLPTVLLQDTVTTQLFINTTEGNNGTVIQCIDSVSNNIISETIMIIVGAGNGKLSQ